VFFLKALPTEAMIRRHRQDLGETSETEILDVLTELRRASQTIRSVDAYFSDHGLSLLKFLILIVIDRESGRDWLQYSEIADRIDVSKPVLTRTISSLIDSQRLEAFGDPSDKRVRRYKLTQSGQAELDGLMAGYFEVLLRAHRDT
tara:strand:+ start:28027 stop:28464 length:438 start_codon:yes stop_codon:yes gene_type:complete